VNAQDHLRMFVSSNHFLNLYCLTKNFQPRIDLIDGAVLHGKLICLVRYWGVDNEMTMMVCIEAMRLDRRWNSTQSLGLDYLNSYSISLVTCVLRLWTEPTGRRANKQQYLSICVQFTWKRHQHSRFRSNHCS